jgi:hypothetical protein
MKKKSLEYRPNQISLTRTQVEKLAKICEHFHEVNDFTLEVSHESGIGESIRVKFDLFDSNDTNIDITDVSNW